MDDKSKDIFLNDLISLRKLSFNRLTETGLDNMYHLPNDYCVAGDCSKMSRNKRIPLFPPFQSDYESFLDLYGNDPYFNRRPLKKKFKNPRVNAAFKNAWPAFESIDKVIVSLNTIAMGLEFMYMSAQKFFDGVLGLAECLIWVRSVLKKFCSTVELFKLALGFITKLGRLLRIVKYEPTEVAVDITTPFEEMQPEIEIPPTTDGNKK